jgi:hypothetical protein
LLYRCKERVGNGGGGGVSIAVGVRRGQKPRPGKWSGRGNRRAASIILSKRASPA